MPSQPGDRVFVASHGDEKAVYSLGLGTFEGHHRTTMVGGIGKGIETVNPRIRLDSGQIVWGYQTWWMPEERLQQYRDAGYEIIDVDPDEFLAKWVADDRGDSV